MIIVMKMGGPVGRWVGSSRPASMCMPSIEKSKILALKARLSWNTDYFQSCSFPNAEFALSIGVRLFLGAGTIGFLGSSLGAETI